MFQKFSDSNVFLNLEGVPVHILYDTVHLLKNIRNNWINLKDTEKTFYIRLLKINLCAKQNFQLLETYTKKKQI
jgi:hypothetical protein